MGKTFSIFVQFFLFSFFLFNFALAQSVDATTTGLTNCPDLQNFQKLGSRDSTDNGETTLLQKFLKESLSLDNYQLKVTGIFDKATEKFVKAFQAESKLIISGQVGLPTRTEILVACGEHYVAPVAVASDTAATSTSIINNQIGSSTTILNPVFQMSDYWPKPPMGKILLKIFSTGLISKYKNLGKNKFANIEFSGPDQYLDTWFLKIATNTPVLEYSDDIASTSSTTAIYFPGREINWGNTFSVGQTASGKIKIDPVKSIGYATDSQSLIGYDNIKLLEYFPSLTIGSTTFDSVLKFKMNLSFCNTLDCKGLGTGYDFWSTNYWLAKNTGIVQIEYLNGDNKGQKDSLTKICLLGKDKNKC